MAILVCFGLRWALAPFSVVFLLLLLVAKRKSGWGICGSSAASPFLFLFWCFCWSCPHNSLMEPLRFHAEFIIRLTCLYLFSGPSLRATSAEPEEKKTMVRWQLKQDCNPCVKDAVFATFCASCTRGTSLSRILLGR